MVYNGQYYPQPETNSSDFLVTQYSEGKCLCFPWRPVFIISLAGQNEFTIAMGYQISADRHSKFFLGLLAVCCCISLFVESDCHNDHWGSRDEGIIVKDMESQWSPDNRDGRWCKLKPDYLNLGSDLDLLIIGEMLFDCHLSSNWGVLLSTGICFQSAIVFPFFLVVSEGT